MRSRLVWTVRKKKDKYYSIPFHISFGFIPFISTALISFSSISQTFHSFLFLHCLPRGTHIGFLPLWFPSANPNNKYCTASPFPLSQMWPISHRLGKDFPLYCWMDIECGYLAFHAQNNVGRSLQNHLWKMESNQSACFLVQGNKKNLYLVFLALLLYTYSAELHLYISAFRKWQSFAKEATGRKGQSQGLQRCVFGEWI